MGGLDRCAITSSNRSLHPLHPPATVSIFVAAVKSPRQQQYLALCCRRLGRGLGRLVIIVIVVLIIVVIVIFLISLLCCSLHHPERFISEGASPPALRSPKLAGPSECTPLWRPPCRGACRYTCIPESENTT